MWQSIPQRWKVILEAGGLRPDVCMAFEELSGRWMRMPLEGRPTHFDEFFKHPGYMGTKDTICLWGLHCTTEAAAVEIMRMGRLTSGPAAQCGQWGSVVSLSGFIPDVRGTVENGWNSQNLHRLLDPLIARQKKFQSPFVFECRCQGDAKTCHSSTDFNPREGDSMRLVSYPYDRHNRSHYSIPESLAYITAVWLDRTWC
jgi:hypothetical protein